MSFLYFLETLRTPFLDSFFSTATRLGEETFMIVIGILIFWCFSKKEGYYLLSVGFIGIAINQMLKLIFRVPRPWVLDEKFTIVESARAAASGYSFPSGHTQTSVGIFGSIARWNKITWLRIICIAVCVIVPFSRMYLGVHTPLDVGVGIAISLILIFIVYPIVSKHFEDAKVMRILFGFMLVLTVGSLLFTELYNFPADIDMHNLASGQKNSYTMLGCVLGFFISYELDRKFIQFETKAVWWVQVIKFVLGITLLLTIKSSLKAPLYSLFGGSYVADAVRYFVVVLFAGCVWPLSFKFFNSLSKKKSE